ncbi:MAG: YigZ family protein [Bacteroidales bacterium]|nr:YigZ family protein [Bacteroidales bacterium]
MTDSFKTISSPSEGLFKDKGSKFLAFAYPVSNEEEIGQILNSMRKEFHDARHHCYAWMLGEEKEHFRVNDDGEPSNSAGKPILGQIQSKDLSNILIVVVRYFGGTLLGIGGLMQAYKTAAKEALESAKIIKKYIHKIYLVQFKYEEMNSVMKVLKDLRLEHFDQVFELNCSLKVRVKRSVHEKFEKSFELNENIKIEFIREE